MLEWLRHQLDEDEVYARNAYGDHNKAVPEWSELWSGAVSVGPDEDLILTGDSQITRHIVRNDPASTLARVAAHRAILADILAEKHFVLEDDCWYTCRAATEERDGGETCNDEERGKACDCGRDARVLRRVRLLAAGYAGRDGYDEAWMPR
jgi:hypothetical protein